MNYAGRSVISPDPNISANEVGIPINIAVKLTFPETVTRFNAGKLRELIINGPLKYPGANIVEKDGKLKSLEHMNEEFRKKEAANLALGSIVHRHLMYLGDILLVNRQPTLHNTSHYVTQG